MTAIRPILLGLTMAAVAAFGTDYILQKRAARDVPSNPVAKPSPGATTPSGASTVADLAAPYVPPAAGRPDPTLDLKVGERAMSLPVKEGALDTFLRPGSLIDVLATIDYQTMDADTGRGTRQTSTIVVAQGARVIAVHERDATRSSRRPSITIAVGSKAAGSIELAATKGAITFVARSKNEPTAEDSNQVSLTDLVKDPGRERAASAAAEAELEAARSPEWSVRVIRGALSTDEGVGKQ